MARRNQNPSGKLLEQGGNTLILDTGDGERTEHTYDANHVKFYRDGFRIQSHEIALGDLVEIDGNNVKVTPFQRATILSLQTEETSGERHPHGPAEDPGPKGRR